jgi:type IV secretion system protein VirB4
MGLGKIQNTFNKLKTKDNRTELTHALVWSHCIKRQEYITDAIKIEYCIVIHKDGCIQQSYGFRGNDLDSFSANYINSISIYMNESIKRLGDGWMVSIEAQRFTTCEYPESHFDLEAGYLVEQERKENFESYGEHFDSSYYITFVYKPEIILKKKAANLFFDNIEYAKLQEDEINNFVKEVKRLTGLLSTRLLIRPLNYEETVQYLHSTVSLRRFDFVLPDHFLFLDSLVADQSIQIGTTLKLDDIYIPILVIHDFPMETYPSILHELNKVYIEYRWVSRYFPLDKKEAMKELDKWQGKHNGAKKNTKQLLLEMSMDVETQKENIGASELVKDVGEAMKEIEMDYVGLGYYNSCIMVWDIDFDKAMAKLNQIRNVIEGCGFSCKEETFNALNAFLGMTTGDIYRNIRRPLISTGNFAHVLPLSAVWAGMLSNKFSMEVCGIDKPLVTCSTDYGTPFFLNLNDGDVGHSLIFGPTGSGKSTLLGLLEISYVKYPNAQVFIIDKGLSALTMTLAVGGEYIDPSEITYCFQPLGDIDTMADKVWACSFIETLIELQGVKVTAAISVQIRITIEAMALLEKEMRTLTCFNLNCVYRDPITGTNTIRDAIIPYTLDGPYGVIFDGNDTKINDSRWVLFEMSELMEMKEKVVAPAIMFIFHYLEKKFKGQMTLLVIDEAWRFLEHEIFRNKMRQWLKELRKKHVFCVFATQEVADGANSSIASTLIQNCPTKIYLADPEAGNNKESYEKFGLTGEEVDLIMMAQKKRDYYFKSTLGTRLFQLSLGPITLGLMRQQDQLIRTRKGDIIRWGKYCEYLLHLRNEKGIREGFVEKILNIQGIEYEKYLEKIEAEELSEVR